MRPFALPALSVSMLAIASTLAGAADLPSRRAPPVYAPPPPIPVFTYTGFFVGGNAGAAFDERRTNSYFFPAGSVVNSSGTQGTLTTTGNTQNVAFTGGAQIGYNFQLGNGGLGGLGGLANGLGGGLFGANSGIIFGVVADAQYLDSNNGQTSGLNYGFQPAGPGQFGNAFVPVPGLPPTNVVSTRERINFYGTVRGRLGVTFDRVLVYGTGGFAYNTRTTGYAVGGGLEYGITNNITVGGEYLYVNLNQGAGYAYATYIPSNNVATGGTLFLTARGGQNNFSVARAFVNYKFDMFAPSSAPVVARY